MTTRCWLLSAALFLLPSIAQAQDATINGTVTDTTGGVLPGVTVTALHTATGNTFFAVTDDRGNYRIPLRVGMYRLTLELQGFAAVARQFEALVGQTLTINVQLMPSTVQESVTVTGEAPLIETSSSTLAGNIDPRQTRDLPVNGATGSICRCLRRATDRTARIQTFRPRAIDSITS
jgi:carboxypeptidase family protein